MVNYTFAPQAAVDIETGDLATGPGLSGSVYSSEANAQSLTSPLTVTVAGGLTSTTISVSTFGQLPEFTVADYYQVWWRSGDVIVHLISFDGLLSAAETGAAASAAAQAAAEDALAQLEALIASGGGGTGGGVSDHGLLAGLGDDDHQQYFNQTRGDGRYYTKTQVEQAIANALSSAAGTFLNRANHTGSQSMASIVGLAGALTVRPIWQDVVNGTEPRPEGSNRVLWVGGPAMAENIGPADVQLQGALVSTGDITPPSAPGKPVASAVAATSLTLTWTAATDDTGVTGYRVRVNGTTVLSGTPAGLSRLITGLNPSTAYTFEVAARDANSNWGPYSPPSDSVTTSASADTTPPTPPTTVTPSSITASGFTLNWSGATDAVGVTGYRVLLNGVQYATPSGTSQVVTGRTAGTAHAVTIQARDAAGNWSDPSAEITVTTTGGGSLATHNVFATAPGALVKTVESSAYEHATGFYTYGGTVTGWKVKGARLWVPSGVTVPTSCEVNLYAPGSGSSAVAPTLGTPTKTATMSGIVSGAWNTVNFPSTELIEAGEVWWIGIKFSDGTWLGVTPAGWGEAFVPAADGSALVLADRVPNSGLVRNYRRIGTGSTVELTGGTERDVWFGMDPIVEVA